MEQPPQLNKKLIAIAAGLGILAALGIVLVIQKKPSLQQQPPVAGPSIIPPTEGPPGGMPQQERLRTLQERPTIAVLSVPNEVSQEGLVRVEWLVSSPSSTILAAARSDVHWGGESRPLSGTAADETAYPNVATPVNISFPVQLPKGFYATFPAPKDASTIYLRGHVIIDGINYWTEEHTIKIE